MEKHLSALLRILKLKVNSDHIMINGILNEELIHKVSVRIPDIFGIKQRLSEAAYGI